MPTATKLAAKKSPPRKSTSTEKPSSTQQCWPGFERTPGKAAGEKGSCQPKSGPQPKSVRRADQKAAAATKLHKANPR